MKASSFVSLIFIFATALGVAASPTNTNSVPSNDLAMEDEAEIKIKYYGKCFIDEKMKMTKCKYDGPNGRTSFCRCHFKRCTKNGAKCHFDSVNKDCYCS
ncbi:antifungal protein precursor [Aspergillus alliaceus]|uniref:Antifungal protein n=1 Tax=Petromyces alliaceus TaxID=209559 RepID=A0A5N7CHB9_PETAA|nr:antifungal protein precursor [Aspergillus alliaceus]